MAATRSVLGRAMSDDNFLRSIIEGGGAEPMRVLLGRQDPSAKTFLKNLTRFHRLKRRLDAVADDIVSEAFLENSKYASVADADLRQAEGGVAFHVANADRAYAPLAKLIASAVEAAGLSADSQPDSFIEIAANGDALYTSATLGPRKTEARIVEKTAAEYDGDHRRCVDIARATIVVDTEKQLVRVFDALLATGKVRRLKNRFTRPSFNGYRDALFNLGLDLGGGVVHVVEVQVHLSPILESKAEAHEYYGFFRRYFHGNMGACDACMALLDKVVGRQTFSVRLLERAAESDDASDLRALAELFDHKCSQYGVALIFRKRLCAVEAGSASRAGPAGGRALSTALNALASQLRKVACYEDADRCARHAVAMSRAALAEPEAVLGPDIAAGLREQGATELTRGRLEKADAALSESLAVYERARGGRTGHPHRGRTLLYLAMLRKEQARYADGLVYAERAVEDLSENPPKLAQALTVMGTIHQHLGQDAASLACYERGFEIRRRAIGVEHPDTAETLRKLATAKRRLGDLAGSSSGYARAYKVFAKANGDRHPDTVKVLADHAECELARGDAASAKALASRARAAAVSLFGDDAAAHLLVRETAAILGAIASFQGDYAGARKLIEPAAAVEAGLGMPPTFRATLLVNDARERRANGESPDRVAEPAREALAIFKAAFRTNDEIALATSFLPEGP